MGDAAFPSPIPKLKLNPTLEEHEEDGFHRGNAPLKYIPLCGVYSTTTPCVTARSSKKVKAAARKPPEVIIDNTHDQLKRQPCPITATPTPHITFVYYRRRKRKVSQTSFFDVYAGKLEELDDGGERAGRGIKRSKKGISNELMKLGADCKSSCKLDVDTRSSDISSFRGGERRGRWMVLEAKEMQ